MTQTMARQEQGSSVAERLRAARERTGLSLTDASAATGLLRSYLVSLEAGRRRPLPAEVDRLARAYDADLSDLLVARRPVEVDEATGRLVVDGRERQVSDLADEREVCAACLFLLYAVRGAQPGERIPLRSSDVERLMAVVGEDAATIERRLVELMGCTPAEATRLRRVLLRHKALTAAVGAAAALSWVAVAAPTGAVEMSTPAPLSGATSSASYYDVDDPDGVAGVTAPVQDQLDGTWSPSYR